MKLNPVRLSYKYSDNESELEHRHQGECMFDKPEKKIATSEGMPSAEFHEIK